MNGLNGVLCDAKGLGRVAEVVQFIVPRDSERQRARARLPLSLCEVYLGDRFGAKGNYLVLCDSKRLTSWHNHLEWSRAES